MAFHLRLPALTADQSIASSSSQVTIAKPRSSKRVACRAAESKQEASTSEANDSIIQKLVNEFNVFEVTPKLVEPSPMVQAALLPEKNMGILRGGQYPFTYDPVYGLPVVNEVASYGEVLRDMREGRVKQLLWFVPKSNQNSFVDGRCIIRYQDGSVKQSVIPLGDNRIKQAMATHAVAGLKIPLEPRHIPSIAMKDASAVKESALKTKMSDQYDIWENSHPDSRRGPRIGPTLHEDYLLAENRGQLNDLIDENIEALEILPLTMEPMPQEDWDAYVNESSRTQMSKDEAQRYEAAHADEKVTSWMDNIQVSSNVQAFIIRYVPILGPVIGSAFIIALYMASRLVKGDLTDRMKLMTQEDEKRKRSVLKEARIAFLEEETPALVAKGTSLDDLRKKCVEVNKKMGEKLEIADSELVATYEACLKLMEEGEDLSGGAGSSSAAARILDAEDASEKLKAKQSSADGGGEGQQKNPDDALMEMGKLNTARIRKATDPKIMDVKRRVRAARRSLKRESKVTLSDEIIFFDDVAGNAQAKVELLEIVDFFRKPEKFRSSGAKAPKGVLLVGPPGNGKTLMARAVAGESGVAFISSSASEFIEMYMGLGAARVRDVFNTARKMAPCIIFIDELDAVGRARRTGGGGNDERDNTVNQLLTEMDGFEAESQGIVVMAATNRKDVLDAALTRAGRFDRSIEVRRPDFQGRLEAVKVHLREKPISPLLDYTELAKQMGGMSGAQIAGVCNQGCFLASRDGKDEVGMVDLLRSIDQSKYGRAQDINRFISPARKRRFAIMEGAISMVATLLPAMEPVDYVTLSPSTQSPIGRTVLKSNIARYTTGMWTKRYLKEQLLVALSSRAAEELVFGPDELSSLNQHRIMFARQIVTKMLNAGMSEHPDFENLRTLGAQWQDPSFEPGRWTMTTVTTDYNRSRSEWIDLDMEAERLLNNAYADVKELLSRNMNCLEKLAEMLISNDRMSGDEIRLVVEDLAHPDDLAVREETKEVAFL